MENPTRLRQTTAYMVLSKHSELKITRVRLVGSTNQPAEKRVQRIAG